MNTPSGRTSHSRTKLPRDSDTLIKREEFTHLMIFFVQLFH